MYQIQEVIKCYLFLIITCFLWTHPLRSKLSKTPFIFSSKYEDLIRAYVRSKKTDQWWGNVITYWEESQWSKALSNKCQKWWNLAGVQSQEKLYPSLILETLLLSWSYHKIDT